MVGTVVKAKVGYMEEDIREVFSRKLRKEMTGVVQDVVGNIMYSVRFQDGLEKEIFLNQLTILVVRSEVEEEIKVRRRLRMCSSVMRESAIGAWFFRTKKEGWMGQRPFYMLRSGISKIQKRRRW